MKRILKNILLLNIAGLLFACGGGETKTESPAPLVVDTVKQEVCTYSLVKDSVKVFWTAYKLSQKTPVTGRFMSPVVTGDTLAENAYEVFKNTTIEVLVANQSSKDADRDKKIAESFFGKMVSTSSIVGVVKRVSMDGAVVVALKMNGVEKEYTGVFDLEGDWAKCTLDINVEDFNGAEALKSLNTVCKERHTGTDGVNKLWPDVRIMVQALVKKECK